MRPYRSFESYVRTVLRLREDLPTARSGELLLQKMPFDSRYYPLYVNETGLAAKEMWARMWLRRKGSHENAQRMQIFGASRRWEAYGTELSCFTR
ncbi:MAG: hypothetical protein ACLTXL_04855 [Clostridia bacterium]